VSVNTYWLWWMSLSHYWMRLTMVWPWDRLHLCENWTAPECDWVCMNTCEWALNTPWMLLSAHEHRWDRKSVV
jgi:hypothetical protein